MVAVDDLITLPYTADLTRSGITLACRSLARMYEPVAQARFAFLRQVVGEIAVELAFRRYLQDQGVPFVHLSTKAFSDPDRYDLAIAGRRCELVSCLILDKARIRAIRASPETILDGPALVPTSQVRRSPLRYDDLYIFAFLNALVTEAPGSLARAVAADQPHYLLHPMPRGWSQPGNWASLGRLVMKGDLEAPVTLAVGGQNNQRVFQTETLDLPPRDRTQLVKDYYSLAYLHLAAPPDGHIGIHSPRLGETYLVGASDWGNVWVYGLEIILAGYLRWGDFRRRARRFAPGRQALQRLDRRVEYMAVRIADLQPMGDLMARGKNWARLRRR